jgi:transposase-like protein
LSDSLLLVICQEVMMTRSLSGDLRGRVIAAIEDGVSTREAARRFRIGISTAGAWYRRYRETGEMEARKQVLSQTQSRDALCADLGVQAARISNCSAIDGLGL